MLIEIEDLLLSRAQAALGATLTAYRPLPGGLPQLVDLLTASRVCPPCIFAAWGGADRPLVTREGRVSMAYGEPFSSVWSLLVVTSRRDGETRRRRGVTTPVAIGGYQAAERLAVALDGYTLPDIGTAGVVHLGPVEDAALVRLEVTVVDVRLALRHDLGMGLDLGELDDFLRFEGQIDLAPADGVAEAVAWWERPV